MLNPTVDMVIAMYSKNQANSFDAQLQMEREQIHAWDILNKEMDGVEAEDILKATIDLKLEKDEHIGGRKTDRSEDSLARKLLAQVFVCH